MRKIRDKLMIRFYMSSKNILQTISHNKSFDEMTRLIKGTKSYISYFLRKKVGNL